MKIRNRRSRNKNSLCWRWRGKVVISQPNFIECSEERGLKITINNHEQSVEKTKSKALDFERFLFTRFWCPNSSLRTEKEKSHCATTCNAQTAFFLFQRKNKNERKTRDLSVIVLILDICLPFYFMIRLIFVLVSFGNLLQSLQSLM